MNLTRSELDLFSSTPMLILFFLFLFCFLIYSILVLHSAQLLFNMSHSFNIVPRIVRRSLHFRNCKFVGKESWKISQPIWSYPIDYVKKCLVYDLFIWVFTSLLGAKVACWKVMVAKPE
jgi:hypothetical protein